MQDKGFSIYLITGLNQLQAVCVELAASQTSEKENGLLLLQSWGCGVWGVEGAVSNGQELLPAPPEPAVGSGVH